MPEHPSPAERREWATSLLEGTTPGPWRWLPPMTVMGPVAPVASNVPKWNGPLLAAAPDLAAAVRDLAEQVEFSQARGDEHLNAFVEAVAERDAARAEVAALREALSVIAADPMKAHDPHAARYAAAVLTGEPKP